MSVVSQERGASMKDSLQNEIAVYSRKSKFTGKGESIENQIELCRQHIRIHFPNTDESNILVYEDEGYSGGNIDRPKFKAMMNDARNKKISVIVCYRLDRISRNIGDFAKLIEELKSLNVSFVSIKEQFDTDTPLGRAMMYIASVFSQLERETIAERIRDNMLELAKTGRWLGGNTPTGYASRPIEKVTADGKVHKAFMLAIMPEEAQLVRVIFDKFFALHSLSKVETFLMQSHIDTKMGKDFTRFSIRNILQNPVYMIADEDAFKYFEQSGVEIFSEREAFDGKHGIMAYNKTIQEKGKTNQTRNMDEWIIAVGKHEGLISGADWIQAHMLLAQNKSKSYRKPKSNSALLSGLLFCSCGAYMRPKQSQRRNNDGEVIFSYLCETKEKSRCRNCNSRNLNGNNLDKMICEEIKKLSADEATFIVELEKAKESIELNADEYGAELNMRKNKAFEMEKEIKSLVSALAKSPEETHEYITKQIQELHEKKALLKNLIAEMESLTQNHILFDEEFDILRGLLSSFSKTFETMNIEQKRVALRAFIQKIIRDGEIVHLYFFDSGDTSEIVEWPGSLESQPGLEPQRKYSK